MTTPRSVHVETGVGMAYDSGSAVWSYELDLWGQCTQGRTPSEALARFEASHGPAVVQETIHGDEQAFSRDHLPASDDELELTLQMLDAQRRRALVLLERTPTELLEADHPERELPEWAPWRSALDMFWHIADTESRYYLPRCGLPPRPRAATLDEELRCSHEHVRSTLQGMARDLTVTTGTEVWTSTKLLRRMAWHERGELDVIEHLVRD